MEGFVSNIVDNKTYRLIYFAIILILLILIMWYHYKAENLTGAGLGTGNAYYGSTSGATMRRLGQEMSQPGQGEYMEIHNKEIKEVFPNLIPKKEGLVGTSQGPNFLEIGNELDVYQRASIEGEPTENLISGTPAKNAEEARLQGLLM
jgi:hypothetical protein